MLSTIFDNAERKTCTESLARIRGLDKYKGKAISWNEYVQIQ